MTILAIGDSITSGNPEFRSPAEVPPDGEGNPKSQYAYWMMQKHPEWHVINRGIGGQRTEHILSRLESELDASKPDIVIIMAGVNDLYFGYPSIIPIANLRRMYEITQTRNLKTVVCTVLPYDSAGDRVNQRLAELSQWILSYSKERGLIYCDTFSVLNDPARPFHLIESNGMHPTPKGYRQLGEAIADALEQSGILVQIN